MPSVIMLSVKNQSIVLNVVLLSVIMLSVVMMSVVMLSVVVLSVVKLNVVILNVVTPCLMFASNARDSLLKHFTMSYFNSRLLSYTRLACKYLSGTKHSSLFVLNVSGEEVQFQFHLTV
jgi:hypothetical protein